MSSFEVIPAIDLLGGRCVRLAQGRYDDVTDYGEPSAAAARFVLHPIPRLHVVDLDAAKSGERSNAEAIAAVVRVARGVPVQLGGGIRSLSAVEAALALGVDRVVIGTAALHDPALVRDAARRFPRRVAVGIDARKGRVAVEGWTQTSDVRALDVARRFADAGVAALVYTDIERDGMLTGPNLESAAEVGAAVSIPVIASGGVGSLEHVRSAAALAGRGLSGVILARALYSGAVDLATALEAGGAEVG